MSTTNLVLATIYPSIVLRTSQLKKIVFEWPQAYSFAF
jgi:hypothetical protein